MPPESEPWIRALEPEDLSFLRRFLLASGSLKDLASNYGVSYPTVRLRLNRLIDKVKVFEKFSTASPFEKTLRLAFADGRIDAVTFKKLLSDYESEKE